MSIATETVTTKSEMNAQYGPKLRTALPGPNARRVVEADDRVISPSYTRSYPMVAKRGRGVRVEDVDGNEFLDFAAGIAVVSTGHCHPDVVRAIHDQSARLIHMSGTDFYYTPQVRLAETLARLAPGEHPKRVFFTNSGAEAIEAALKLARKHTGRHRVAVQFAFGVDRVIQSTDAGQREHGAIEFPACGHFLQTRGHVAANLHDF